MQELLDALAQKVALELVSNTKLVEILSEYIATSSINNTGLVTEEGFVADARQMNPNVAGSLAAKVKKNTDDIVTANSNLASKITVMTYSKANIPIVAGDDFFANIPVDIETSAYRWVFPILSDITGDNSTKINISTCIWQNGQVHIKGNNQATGTANISLSGIVIAIK